jgi:hypothetical protein
MSTEGALLGILGSFAVGLGFTVDTAGIEKFQRRAEELRAAALRLGAVAAGAAIGIGMMVEKAAEGMGELQHFAELNKLSAKEVAALNRVGQDNLITNEAMESSIQSLNIKTGEAVAGVGRGAMIFKKFGLQAKDAQGHTKTFNTILGDVAAKMQHMSRQANMAMAARLGIDPKMVPLLEKGKEYLDGLTNQARAANPFSDEDYERALKVDVLFTKAKRTLTVLTNQIAVALMPVVQQALEKFLAWYSAMRADTAGTFNRALKILGGTLETVWVWTSRLIDVITAGAKWVAQFEAATWAAKAAVGALVAYKVGVWAAGAADALKAMTLAMLGFDGAAAAFTATGVGAAIILLAWALNDLMKGNQSVISQFVDKIPHATAVLSAALAMLSAGWVALKWKAITSMLETMQIMALYAAEWIAANASMAVAAWAAIAPVLAIAVAIGLVIAAIYLWWKNWTDIKNYMLGTWEILKEKVNEYLDAIKNAWQKAKEFFGLGSGSATATVIQQGVAAGGGLPGSSPGGAPSGVMGVPSGNNVRSHTVQQSIGSVNIHLPSTDPSKAGQAVKEVIDPMRGTRTLIRNSQSGVLA